MRYFFFLALFLPLAALAESCPAECPVPDVSALWDSSDAIFVGRVENNNAPGLAPVPGYEYGAVFSVTHGWKKAANTNIMTVRAKHHPRLCTVPFSVGYEYLVFAKRNSKGGYYTDIAPCSPNLPIERAAVAINQLDLIEARGQSQ